MNKVNLFIIGVNKGGSTWLHYLLNEHPEIYMSKRKEHYFFGYVYPEKIEEYNKNFPFEQNYKYFGESTPHYYLNSKAAYQIKEYSPQAKIMVIVRDPIERLLSWIYFNKQLGNIAENKGLKEIIYELKPKIRKSSHYELYLPNYEQIFGKNQFIMFSLEEAQVNKTKFWTKLQNFLGVKKIKIPEISNDNRNSTGSKYFRMIYRNTVRKIAKKNPQLYKKLLKSSLMKNSKQLLLKILGKARKESLDSEVYNFLLKEYRETYNYLDKKGFKEIYKK